MGRDRTARLRDAITSLVVTRRGIGFVVAAVVTFVAAPLLSLPALLYVTGLLLGLLVVSTVFVFVGHSRVRIERSFSPQVVAPGRSTRATLRVTNLSVLPCLEADWDDRLPYGISGDHAGTLPALGSSRSAASRATFSYELHGVRRGRHEVGPLRVAVHDPFGLVHRRHSFGGAGPLTVLPRRVDLPPITPRGASDDGATRPAPQNVGVGDDDIIARTYLPGDALKRIHWKATAHRAELMVRQEEQQVTPRAAVVLDTEPVSQGTTRDRKDVWEYSPALEWAVVAAASITAHLARAGYVVALQSNGTSLDRVVAEGHDTLEDAMVDLALVQPDPVDRAGRHDAEGAAFVVLGRLTVERAEQWVAALSTSRTILALVARGTSSRALDVLDAARWNVVSWAPGDDLADAWASFDGASTEGVASRAAR
jgi:uncharacterized protein (DUF58 family)